MGIYKTIIKTAPVGILENGVDIRYNMIWDHFDSAILIRGSDGKVLAAC